MLHKIKIEQCHLIHILEGTKTFEIRLNDRNYQVGDIIEHDPIQTEQNYDYEAFLSEAGTIELPRYEITHVHSGFGLIDGWIILGIKQLV